MIMNRIVKWAVASVLAVGTLPAIGFARTRASLPSAVSVTPVSLMAAVSRKHPAKRISVRAKRSPARAVHKKAVRHRKAVARRHVASKHARIYSKARSRKSSHARRSISHKTTKRA